MLKSDLYHYSDAYIVVKRAITAADSNNIAYVKKLAFKSAPFKCTKNYD